MLLVIFKKIGVALVSIGIVIVLLLTFALPCMGAEIKTRILHSVERKVENDVEVLTFLSDNSRFFATVRESANGNGEFSYSLISNAPRQQWLDLGDEYKRQLLVKIGSFYQDGKSSIIFPVGLNNQLTVFRYEIGPARLKRMWQLQLKEKVDIDELFCNKDECYVAGTDNGRFALWIIKMIDKKPQITKFDLLDFHINRFTGIYVDQNIFLATVVNTFNGMSYETRLLEFSKSGYKGHVVFPGVRLSAPVMFLGGFMNTQYWSVNQNSGFPLHMITKVFAVKGNRSVEVDDFTGFNEGASAYLACNGMVASVEKKGLLSKSGPYLSHAILGEWFGSDLVFANDTQRVFSDIKTSADSRSLYVAAVYRESRSQQERISVFSVLEIPLSQLERCKK